MVPKLCSVEGCEKPKRTRGLCDAHYARFLRHGDPMGAATWDHESLFWAKVNKDGPTPSHVPEIGQCWEWDGYRNEKGYGVVRIKRQAIRAHRFSLEMSIGRPILPGLVALHACDNPPCVNPEHLSEGTQRKNLEDSKQKGRHLHGELRATKLTERQVVEMRTRAADGEKNRYLAEEFGVQASMVSMVTRGLLWESAGGPLSKKYNTRKQPA